MVAFPNPSASFGHPHPLLQNHWFFLCKPLVLASSLAQTELVVLLMHALALAIAEQVRERAHVLLHQVLVEILLDHADEIVLLLSVH